MMGVASLHYVISRKAQSSVISICYGQIDVFGMISGSRRGE